MLQNKKCKQCGMLVTNSGAFCTKCAEEKTEKKTDLIQKAIPFLFGIVITVIAKYLYNRYFQK